MSRAEPANRPSRADETTNRPPRADETVTTNRPPPADDTVTKTCCARLYESDLATYLLGNSFHPGGEALTSRLGALIALTPDRHVLDVAAGRGSSAFDLARRFGCRVTGIDYGSTSVRRANERAVELGLSDRVRFECADAEHLPFPDETFDAVTCECAFCTFPDKVAAAHEFARVLRPGGRVGLSDLTTTDASSPDFADLMGWISCLGDARPAAAYARYLSDAGFETPQIEAHDAVLHDLMARITQRLFAAELLRGLDRLELPGVDFPAANRMARQAAAAVSTGRLGYAIVTARLP